MVRGAKTTDIAEIETISISNGEDTRIRITFPLNPGLPRRHFELHPEEAAVLLRLLNVHKRLVNAGYGIEGQQANIKMKLRPFG